MKRNFVTRYAMMAVALSMVMVGCDSVQDSALVGPGEKNDVLLTYRTEEGYTIARETDATLGVVSAVIDQNGGVLSIGKHLLWVPQGAVTAPTTFVMTKFPGEIKVDLSATRLLPNDVGNAGFLKPVRLTLSYADVANITPEQLAAIKILWARPDGTFEQQQSYINQENKTVNANLNHFSIYTMGWGIDG